MCSILREKLSMLFSIETWLKHPMLGTDKRKTINQSIYVFYCKVEKIKWPKRACHKAPSIACKTKVMINAHHLACCQLGQILNIDLRLSNFINMPCLVSELIDKMLKLKISNIEYLLSIMVWTTKTILCLEHEWSLL